MIINTAEVVEQKLRITPFVPCQFRFSEVLDREVDVVFWGNTYSVYAWDAPGLPRNRRRWDVEVSASPKDNCYKKRITIYGKTSTKVSKEEVARRQREADDIADLIIAAIIEL